MQIIQGEKTIAKAWIDGVELEEEARQQIIIKYLKCLLN